jgi:hypothetical protein
MTGAEYGLVGTSESHVRKALHSFLRESLKLPESRFQIVDEFWVPRSHERADVAVIGSMICGYEIKTARDSLKRLPRQTSAYNRLFQQCAIVLAERHLASALSILPHWWGVSVITGEDVVKLETLRVPSRNPDIDPETLVRLLWRDEVVSVLTDLGAPPCSNTDRFTMWGDLLEMVDVNNLCGIVGDVLLNRDPSQARIATRRFSTPLGR